MAAINDMIKVEMAPEMKELLQKSKDEFEKGRRKVELANIPNGVDITSLKDMFLKSLNAEKVEIKERTVLTTFKNYPDAQKAVDTLTYLNSNFAKQGITVNFPEPDSLLFVGNLPFEVTEDELGVLMSQYGKLQRVFLVRSEITGESKGYGFVEYTDKNTAGEAKQEFLKSSAKYISGRVLRVDFAEPNLRCYKDLHSKTLFLDKLPRDFTNGDVLRQLFSKSGRVNYAQVAISPQSGASRGFAFIDYETSEDAERGQMAHNNAKIGDCEIRASYATPGRTGASVLGPVSAVPEKPKPLPLVGGATSDMGPRPLMSSGPMICPDPSAHMIRGPMPLMTAGPQAWNQRPGQFPRPGLINGAFPGQQPIGNQSGSNPMLASPRPLIAKGPPQGLQPNNGPTPLMPGIGKEQSAGANFPSAPIQFNNNTKQGLPQPLMQSTPANQQQAFNNTATSPPSLMGPQPANILGSGNQFGTTSHRGPTPLMTAGFQATIPQQTPSLTGTYQQNTPLNSAQSQPIQMNRQQNTRNLMNSPFNSAAKRPRI